MRKYRLLLLSSASALGITCAGLAHAQTAASPKNAAVEEVIVTASKRETTVQKSPLAITALGAKELQSRGVTDVAGLIGEVPGLSIKSNGPGETEFEMRGLTSAGGSAPTVGFYLDDTPLTAPAATQTGKVEIDPDLYDLNRIEVLRGPQGTLYGAGSMGGTIRLITNQPNLDKYQATEEVVGSGTDGGGLNQSVNGMVNIPLIKDQLALRLVGSETQNSGWIDQIVVADLPPVTGPTRVNVGKLPVLADNHDVNREDLAGGRATLLYTPTDRLSITASVFYQQLELGGPSAYDSNPGTQAHYTPFNLPEPISDRFVTWATTVKYRFDAFDVTSTTASWNRGESVSQDEDEAVQFAFGLPSVYPSQGGVGGGNYVETDKSRQVSEELRLTSRGDGRFQWIIGGFFADLHSEENGNAVMPDAVPVWGTDEQYIEQQPTRIRQEAAFGEASYAITPKLKATVGLRYYSYDFSNVTYASGEGATGSNAVSVNKAAESNQGINPKFNLAYQATDDLLFYGTAAKGFRPGGGNEPIPVSPTTTEGASCLAALSAFGKTQAPLAYNPDSVWSYEVGEKAALFDKRLTVNASAYYEDWSGIQESVALACGYVYTDNIANANIYGLELESHAVLGYGLSWSGSAAYTNAALANNVSATGAHKGDPLQEVAPWTASSALTYTTPINDAWNASGRMSFDYVGNRVDATYYPMNHLPAYTIVKLRAGVENDKWGIFLFVNNLTNTRAMLSDTPSLSINLPTYNRVATNQPLTIGLDINHKF